MEKLNLMIINKAYACWDIFRFGGPTMIYLNKSRRFNKVVVQIVHEQRFQSGYLWQLRNYDVSIFKDIVWKQLT